MVPAKTVTPDGFSVVVIARDSTLALVRTADSAVRQSAAPLEVVLASDAQSPIQRIIETTATRLDAKSVVSHSWIAALNAAVAAAIGDHVLVVPAGFRLEKDCIARCADVLAEELSTAAVAPLVRIQSVDAVHSNLWSSETTLSGLILNPSRVPPVVAVRRSWWETEGGLNETFGLLALYELCLRLAVEEKIRVLSDELVAVDAAETFERRLLDDSDYLRMLRRVYDRHRVPLEELSSALLLNRLVNASTLAARHRELVGYRDDAAAELDAMRTEIATLRARLADRGRGAVEWGDFRRLSPISREWGFDRGNPIDRYYIESFLASTSSDVRGVVLEVQSDDCTRRFGGPRVLRADVVDLNDSNRQATSIADLRYAPHLPNDVYDCIILTQTLHVIDDMPAVLKECLRILKPGGVLLSTLPATSRTCLEYGELGDFWRVTPAGAARLVESVFGIGAVEAVPYGNVQTNIAFLQGLATTELTKEEFDRYDPYYPVLTGVRARKANRDRPRRRSRQSRPLVLLYHRVSEEVDVHSLAVTPAHFRSHLEWLASNCNVLPLDALLSTPPDDLPEAAVALSFDDGYLDNLEVAAPMLAADALPASFFLTTRWLHEEGEYWWDALERAILGPVTLPPALSVDLPGGPVTLPTRSRDDRIAAHDRLHRELVSAALDTRERLVAFVDRWSGAPRSRRRPVLADEALSLARLPGVTIGAHGVNHLALTHQSDDTIAYEAKESRLALERVSGRPVGLFAYPYGASDARVGDRLRLEYGWSMSCGDAAIPSIWDAARVPRLEIKDSDAEAFEKRVAAALDKSDTHRRR